MTQKSTLENGNGNGNGNINASASPGANAMSGTKNEGIEGVAREIKVEVKHLASDVAGEAKKAAESKLGAGKDYAAEHLGGVADALRKASAELRSSQSPATEYVDKAATSVEMISKYFQTRTLSQLIGDVEGYARREPAVFLGGAFFAGMLGGRFLKSATPARPVANANANASGATGKPSQGGEAPRALPARGGSTSMAHETNQKSQASDMHGSGNGNRNGNSPAMDANKGNPGQGSANKPGTSHDPNRSGKGPGVA